jgi:hypothetical protein
VHVVVNRMRIRGAGRALAASATWFATASFDSLRANQPARTAPIADVQ